MKYNYIIIGLLVLVGAGGVFAAYKKIAPATSTTSGNVHTLAISHLDPSTGKINSQVTIAGSGFTSDNTVHFGQGVIPHVSSSNGNTLTFTVPDALKPPCAYTSPACAFALVQTAPGVYTVSVTNAHGTSNSLNFTVTSGFVCPPNAICATPNTQ